MCACIVWSHDHLEYVLIVQVNHCHEEQLAKRKQEMEIIIARNKTLKKICDELLTRTEHVTKEKETEIASKDEQVNHCHEEQLAKLKQEMERIMASKDDEISQLQVQNKHLVSYCDELQTRSEQKATEMASKNEQIALLQLENKELPNLKEELQAKNQQVKQYKKQVDSYKTELERCQKELERCQGELLEVDVMGAMVYG